MFTKFFLIFTNVRTKCHEFSFCLAKLMLMSDVQNVQTTQTLTAK